MGLVALVVAFAATAHSQGQPQNQEPAKSEQQPQTEQRGTPQAPFIVQIQAAEQAQNKATQNATERPKEGGNGWFVGWGLSDKIAAIACVAAALQFGALVVTILVMVHDGHRQLRAYVFADHGGLFDGTQMNPPNPQHANEPGLVLVFKNYGQTPAYKVVCYAQIVVQPPGNESDLIAPTFQEHFVSLIGPGGTMPKTLWYGRQLTADEIQDVANTRKIIYVYGRIEYRDAFKRKRRTNFRYAYAGPFPAPPGTGLAVTERGNDAN